MSDDKKIRTVKPRGTFGDISGKVDGLISQPKGGKTKFPPSDHLPDTSATVEPVLKNGKIVGYSFGSRIRITNDKNKSQ